MFVCTEIYLFIYLSTYLFIIYLFIFIYLLFIYLCLFIHLLFIYLLKLKGPDG